MSLVDAGSITAAERREPGGRDPDAHSDRLTAACALVPVYGQAPERGCRGVYEIRFEVSGAGPKPEVSAEMLALDGDGNVLESMPVHEGDIAQLSSTVHPRDAARVKAVSQQRRHKLSAPVPLLHVTARDGQREAHAYCSNIPLLRIMEPSQSMAVRLPGEPITVLVAIPFVDPSTLAIRLDGVDILAALNLSPDKQFPGGPYHGEVRDGDRRVLVVDELRVESSGSGEAASNTLFMKLSRLDGSAPLLVVEGRKLEEDVGPPDRGCYVDDLREERRLDSGSRR